MSSLDRFLNLIQDQCNAVMKAVREDHSALKLAAKVHEFRKEQSNGRKSRTGGSTTPEYYVKERKITEQDVLRYDFLHGLPPLMAGRLSQLHRGSTNERSRRPSASSPAKASNPTPETTPAAGPAKVAAGVGKNEHDAFYQIPTKPADACIGAANSAQWG